MQQECVLEWDEPIAESKPCTECGRPSDGYTCCHTSHPLCEACSIYLADGYQYCKRHVQDARDEIAERAVYAALANLNNVALVQAQGAYRCKELIANLARLAAFYMRTLKPLEAKDDAE